MKSNEKAKQRNHTNSPSHYHHHFTHTSRDHHSHTNRRKRNTNTTKQAKELSEIAEEKERVALVIDDLKTERYQNKEVDEPRFQKMVDGGFGTGKAIGTKNDPNYIITVNKTGNMYEIDDEGNISNCYNTGKIKGNETAIGGVVEHSMVKMETRKRNPNI